MDEEVVKVLQRSAKVSTRCSVEMGLPRDVSWVFRINSLVKEVFRVDKVLVDAIETRMDSVVDN